MPQNNRLSVSIAAFAEVMCMTSLPILKNIRNEIVGA